jgi:hypothetical protein
MNAHEQRVIDEKTLLDDKINKLANFLSTEVCAKLSNYEHDLLVQQFTVMSEYSKILGYRVHIFEAKNNGKV